MLAVERQWRGLSHPSLSPFSHLSHTHLLPLAAVHRMRCSCQAARCRLMVTAWTRWGSRSSLCCCRCLVLTQQSALFIRPSAPLQWTATVQSCWKWIGLSHPHLLLPLAAVHRTRCSCRAARCALLATAWTCSCNCSPTGRNCLVMLLAVKRPLSQPPAAASRRCAQDAGSYCTGCTSMHSCYPNRPPSRHYLLLPLAAAHRMRCSCRGLAVHCWRLPID
jgi:hypothetical protein